MLRSKIVNQDNEAISEEHFATELAKCLAKASLEYSLESVYLVKVWSDDEEIPMTIEVKPGWGE